MQFLLPVLVLSTLVGVDPGARAQTAARPNFSGTWLLRSGGAPAERSHVLTIVHKDLEIRIDRGIDGRKDALTIRTDGKATTAKTECCGEVITTAGWDGSALNRHSTLGTSVMDDTWSLSADGLEPTIVRRTSQGAGVTNARLVLGRK